MNARRPDSAAPLTQARRVVVKVGSALLVDGDSGRANRAWLETLVEDLLRLRRRGQRVSLVSAGAIARGRRRPGLTRGALRPPAARPPAAFTRCSRSPRTSRRWRGARLRRWARGA